MSIESYEADKLLKTINESKNFNEQEIQEITGSLIRRALTTRVTLAQGGKHILVFHIDFTKGSSGLERALAVNKQYKETLLFILRLSSKMDKKNVEEIIEEIWAVCFRYSLIGHPLFIFVLDAPIQLREMILDAFQDSYVSKSNGLKEFLLPSIQENRKVDPRENALQILKRLGFGNQGCPYAYLGPCRPDMFFGREKLLRELLLDNQQAFAITGGRRIGKTSVLIKLKNMVEKGQYPQKSYFPLILDCSSYNSYHKLLDEVTRQLLPEYYYKIKTTRNKSLVTEQYSFDVVLSRSSGMKDMPILLLLDEIDPLIKNIKQSKDPLFEELRSVVNQKKVRLVVAGFREVFEIVSDYKHPLFNLCEKIELGVLLERDVYKLLSIPFRSSNVTFESKDQVIDEIYTKTSGHPCFVQFIAKQLFQRRKDNVIHKDDFQDLLNERVLFDYVLDHFLMNTNDKERKICLTMIDCIFFTLQDTNKALQSQKRDDFNEKVIHEALSNLKMNSILVSDKDTYRFLNPLVVSVIKNYLTK